MHQYKDIQGKGYFFLFSFFSKTFCLWFLFNIFLLHIRFATDWKKVQRTWLVLCFILRQVYKTAYLKFMVKLYQKYKFLYASLHTLLHSTEWNIIISSHISNTEKLHIYSSSILLTVQTSCRTALQHYGEQFFLAKYITQLYYTDYCTVMVQL